MSYAQAMKHSNNHRHDRHRQPIVMGFTNADPDFPSLGGVWFEPGRDEERAAFIQNWRRQRGKICAHCAQTEDLTRAFGYGSDTCFVLCPECQLKARLRNITATVEIHMKDLKSIESNNRMKKRINSLKDKIQELAATYFELSGIKLVSFIFVQPQLF